MKRMSKMEAVGALCELKSQLEREMQYHTDNVEKKDPEGPSSGYHQQNIERYQRWIRAVEIAGAALTR